MKNNSMLIAAGLGGLVMALVSSLPGLSLINCLLCAGVWGSGILAVFIYRKMEKTAPGLTNGQGASIGALAGVVGAVISWGITAIMSLLGVGTQASLDALKDIPGMSDSLQNVPPELLTTSGLSIGSLLCNLVLYVAFGAIGGLIATSLIWKKQA